MCRPMSSSWRLGVGDTPFQPYTRRLYWASDTTSVLVTSQTLSLSFNYSYCIFIVVNSTLLELIASLVCKVLICFTHLTLLRWNGFRRGVVFRFTRAERTCLGSVRTSASRVTRRSVTWPVWRATGCSTVQSARTRASAVARLSADPRRSARTCSSTPTYARSTARSAARPSTRSPTWRSTPTRIPVIIIITA